MFWKKKVEAPVKTNDFKLPDNLIKLLTEAINEPELWSYEDKHRCVYKKNKVSCTIHIDYGKSIWIGDELMGFTYHKGTDDFKTLDTLVDKLILNRMEYALGDN